MTDMFHMRGQKSDIEQRRAKVRQLWTNGRVEGINRATQDAPVKRYNTDFINVRTKNEVSTRNFI